MVPTPITDHPGLLRGWHYTSFASLVHVFQQADDQDAVTLLLWSMVLATEAEGIAMSSGPDPWPYVHLAEHARSTDVGVHEVAILARYCVYSREPCVDLISHLEAALERTKYRVSSQRAAIATPPVIMQAIDGLLRAEATGPFAAAIRRVLGCIPPNPRPMLVTPLQPVILHDLLDCAACPAGHADEPHDGPFIQSWEKLRAFGQHLSELLVKPRS